MVEGIRTRLLKKSDKLEHFFAAMARVTDDNFILGLRTFAADHFAKDKDDQYFVFAAVNEKGKIVGLASSALEDREVTLSQVAVHPAWTGNGIREKLVEARLKHAARKGAHTAEVFIDGNLEKVVPLYEAHGFSQVGRSGVMIKSLVKNG